MPTVNEYSSQMDYYNAVFAMHGMFHMTDLVNVMDNKAIFDACSHQYDGKLPTMDDINRLAAANICYDTACIRFPGKNNSDWRKFITKMNPFPKLKFHVST